MRKQQQSCSFLNSIKGDVDNFESPTYIPATYGDGVTHTEAKLSTTHNLKSLMQDKVDMSKELDRNDELRSQYLRSHRRILGESPDLCRGALDGLLADARKLTVRE